jgi:hypothetical protein
MARLDACVRPAMSTLYGLLWARIQAVRRFGEELELSHPEVGGPALLHV